MICVKSLRCVSHDANCHQINVSLRFNLLRNRTQMGVKTSPNSPRRAILRTNAIFLSSIRPENNDARLAMLSPSTLLRSGMCSLRTPYVSELRENLLFIPIFDDR